MAKGKAKRRLRHKTDGPDLSALDIRFAQLLFDRDLGDTRKSVLDCYIEAGFPRRESDAATVAAAHRRVKNRKFREYFRRHQQHAAEAAQLTSAELLATVANYMRADRRKLFGKDGTILLPDQWPADVAAVVEDVAQDTVSEVVGDDVKVRVFVKRVRTVSKLQAAVKLMEALGILGPDAGKDTGAEHKPLVVQGPDLSRL